MFFDFLSVLMRGGAYSYYYSTSPRRSHWFSVDDPPPIPSGRSNHYFGIFPCRDIPPTNAGGEVVPMCYIRAQAAYVGAINCVYGDFDASHWASPDAFMRHIEGLDPAPSVLISSGGGMHAYWLLDAPYTIDNPQQLAVAKHVIAAWVDRIGSDAGVKDITRVLRIPGTWNHKYSPAPPVSVYRANLAERYTLQTIGSLLPPLHVAHVPPVSPYPPLYPRDIDTYNNTVDVAALLERFGYRRVGRARMTSPFSGSARTGVSIRTDNRAFVFTGGDPLCDGYHKRPFDVLRILEFGGDFRRALEAIKRGHA